MFKRFTLTVLVLLFLASLPACGVNTSTPAASNATGEANSEDNYQMLPVISDKMANISLDASANGTTQQLRMGEVMSVSLDSNPSTGYSWYATLSDPQVLIQMGDAQYQQPATPMPGAPGTQVFYFQAAGKGSTSLTMDYKRSFETNVAPEKTVVITVEVR